MHKIESKYDHFVFLQNFFSLMAEKCLHEYAKNYFYNPLIDIHVCCTEVTAHKGEIHK